MWELGVCLNSRPEPYGNLWGWNPILTPDVRTSVFWHWSCTQLVYAHRVHSNNLGQLVAAHGQSEAGVVSLSVSLLLCM